MRVPSRAFSHSFSSFTNGVGTPGGSFDSEAISHDIIKLAVWAKNRKLRDAGADRLAEGENEMKPDGRPHPTSAHATPVAYLLEDQASLPAHIRFPPTPRMCYFLDLPTAEAVSPTRTH